MYGSQTPLHDGSRTPHYGGQTPSHEPGSMTPGRAGAWDPTVSNTPARYSFFIFIIKQFLNVLYYDVFCENIWPQIGRVLYSVSSIPVIGFSDHLILKTSTSKIIRLRRLQMPTTTRLPPVTTLMLPVHRDRTHHKHPAVPTHLTRILLLRQAVTKVS